MGVPVTVERPRGGPAAPWRLLPGASSGPPATAGRKDSSGSDLLPLSHGPPREGGAAVGGGLRQHYDAQRQGQRP